MPETKQELKRRLGLCNKELAQLRSQLTKQSDLPTQQKQAEAQSQNKPHTAAKPEIVTNGQNLGKFILWLFGVGIGCASNYFSSSPNVLYVSFSAIAALLIWLAWGRRRLWVMISIIVCISFFFCVHKYIVHVLKQEESSAAQARQQLADAIQLAEDNRKTAVFFC